MQQGESAHKVDYPGFQRVCAHLGETSIVGGLAV